MSAYADPAARIMNALKLRLMPVAVSFPDSAPEGHARPAKAAAAGCQFWEQGAVNALSTTADDHKHCAIGIHTHAMRDAPTQQSEDLGATLAAMQGLDYVRDAEVAAIPVLPQTTGIVAYTPLNECEQPPAVVLLFADAAQSLVIAEAIARVDGEAAVAMGRPACALVPAVVNSGRAASSLGCCGARVYLDGLDERTSIWGLVSEKLEAYVAEIELLAKANDTLTRYHTLRRNDIEAGKNPSVDESLSRLAG